MKLYQLLVSQNISGTILYLIILLANIDYVGVLDYAIKAIVGSAIWFGFRVLGDYCTKKEKGNDNSEANAINKMNAIAMILILGAVAYAANIANTGSKSTIKLINVDSIKVVGTEIEISATIAIDNPTANSVAIIKPYLKIYYNGNEYGNSLPSEEQIFIKANGRTEISKVNVRVPMTSLPSLVMAITFSKGSDQIVGIEVFTKVGGIPITDKKEYKIKDLMSSIKK